MSRPDEGAGVPAEDREPADAASVERTTVVGERRTPVVLAAVFAIVVPFFMPSDFVNRGRTIVAALEAALLVAMLLMDPGRIDRRSRAVRNVRIALIVVLVAGSATSSIRLVSAILGESGGTDSATELLWAGGLIWLYLVVAFGFLYWELDSGGPGERAHAVRRHPDLLFPQQMNPELAPPGWRPVFVDYLYVGFTAAIAFSPTDAMPLARWAKAAMAIEATVSIVIVGLVVARAVNILN